MGKLFIYGGITLGSIIGAYLPVIAMHSNPLSGLSILGGFIGSFAGLWLGYKAYQSFDI
ncbi:MAG TPA: hypothetical protein VMR51_02535 [Patescibacteria group bacterium]|nr:hypothetical protein [Patescibacteria group bacterium]